MPFITGRNTIIESLKGNRKVNRVYIAEKSLNRDDIDEIKDLARKKEVSVSVLPLPEIEKIVGKVKQYAAAEVSPFEYADFDLMLEGATKKDSCLIVVLDGVEDPQNLGSIIRTSEFFGADGVVIRKKRACRVTTTVERVSQGAAAHLPVARAPNIAQVIRKAKKDYLFAVGASEKADGKLLTESDLPEKCLLVIGGEDTGLNRLTTRECDMLFSIPGSGKTPSLNLSCAFSIFAYSWVKSTYGS